MTSKDIKITVELSERGFKRIRWERFKIACFLYKQLNRWDCSMHISGAKTLAPEKRLSFFVPHMTSWNNAIVRRRLAELCNKNAQDIIKHIFNALSER